MYLIVGLIKSNEKTSDGTEDWAAGKRMSYQRRFEEAAADVAIEEPKSGANAGDGISDLLVGDTLVKVGKDLGHHTVARVANNESTFFWFRFQRGTCHQINVE